MLVEELRINNFVYEKNKITIIDHHDITQCYFMADVFKPIPLTEEWLLRFGFKKSIGWDDLVLWRQKDFGYDSFELIETLQGYESPSGKIIGFVHLLQNCYYFHELKELDITNERKE